MTRSVSMHFEGIPCRATNRGTGRADGRSKSISKRLVWAFFLTALCSVSMTAPANAQTVEAYEDRPIAVLMNVNELGYTNVQVWMTAEDDACRYYRLYMVRQLNDGITPADEGYWRYDLDNPANATWTHVDGGTITGTQNTWNAICDDGLQYGFAGRTAVGTGNPMMRLTPIAWRYAPVRRIDLENLIWGMTSALVCYLVFDLAAAGLRTYGELFPS